MPPGRGQGRLPCSTAPWPRRAICGRCGPSRRRGSGRLSPGPGHGRIGAAIPRPLRLRWRVLASRRHPGRHSVLPSMDDVTQLLNAIEQGDPRAASQLLPLVYDELRSLAARKLACEAPGQTLQTTALVHEAYLRLAGQGARASLEQPRPLLRRRRRGRCAASSSRAARRKRRLKRGGGLPPGGPRPGRSGGGVPRDELPVDLDEALAGWPRRSPPRLIWYQARFYAGLSACGEAAACLRDFAGDGRPPPGVRARAWLYDRLRARVLPNPRPSFFPPGGEARGRQRQHSCLSDDVSSHREPPPCALDLRGASKRSSTPPCRRGAPTSARPSWDAACAGDVALRGRVETLLRVATQEAGPFLDRPAVEQVRRAAPPDVTEAIAPSADGGGRPGPPLGLEGARGGLSPRAGPHDQEEGDAPRFLATCRASPARAGAGWGITRC